MLQNVNNSLLHRATSSNTELGEILDPGELDNSLPVFNALVMFHLVNPFVLT